MSKTFCKKKGCQLEPGHNGGCLVEERERGTMSKRDKHRCTDFPCDVCGEGTPAGSCDVCADGINMPSRYHGLDCPKRKGADVDVASSGALSADVPVHNEPSTDPRVNLLPSTVKQTIKVLEDAHGWATMFSHSKSTKERKRIKLVLERLKTALARRDARVKKSTTKKRN